MVKKIAVVALVAVIAVPILLGYALNLTETTETGYRTYGDSVNVTPLLQNDTGYNYTHADTYQLNSEFYCGTYVPLDRNQRIFPQYTSYSSVRTSIPMRGIVYLNQSWNNATQGISSATKYFYQQFDYDPASNHHSGTVYQTVGGVDSVVVSINDIQSFYYDRTTGFYQYSIYFNGGVSTYAGGTANTNISKIVLNTTQGTSDVFQSSYNLNYYADISKGFHFEGERPYWYVKLPEKTKSVLFTMDLDSITDANYEIELRGNGNSLIFNKTTTDGVVTWRLLDANTTAHNPITTLYYDPSRSDNTYQVSIQLEDQGISGARRYYHNHTELRYVGSWPTVIGEANYYLKYDSDHDFNVAANTEYSIDFLDFEEAFPGLDITKSPRLRVDDAYFRAFSYDTITNNTYNPVLFKRNPATTIENITQYGSSLTFAGNTYTVSSDGKITLDGHDIPVDGLVFSSVPNEYGTYDNKIGQTFISETGTPSTITFTGTWAASISTKASESFTYTKTEWHAGSFAWDGIDTNFLTVGLITSLGIFIASVVYARMTGKHGMIPLMIVTGCAAAVFFIML